MKILLTGATGMVGRNILGSNTEHEIVTFDNPFTGGRGELLNFSDISHFFRENEVDCVIHAAGRVGGILDNMNNNSTFLFENTIMGLNLAKCAHDAGVKKFVNLGSSCMYPAGTPSPIPESALYTGLVESTNHGYATAKCTMAKYCETLGYPTIIPCNLYGKYDKFGEVEAHMLPAAIRKVHEAKESGAPVEIWGDGTARREFLYAEDLADFILQYIELEQPETMNVGLGHDFSITQLYQAVANVLGYEGEFVYDKSKPTGVKEKRVDISKQMLQGWKPKHSLEEGIEKTYRYYLDEVL